MEENKTYQAINIVEENNSYYNVYYCLSCRVEIPKEFFIIPRTFGNTIARVKINCETHKRISTKRRNYKEKRKNTIPHDEYFNTCTVLYEAKVVYPLIDDAAVSGLSNANYGNELHRTFRR